MVLNFGLGIKDVGNLTRTFKNILKQKNAAIFK